MELGGREILIALGALLVVAILLDGFRRVRRAGEGKLRVKRRRQPIFDGDDCDEFGSELPGGGARVVAFRDEDSAEQFSQSIKANRECDPSRVTSPFRQAEAALADTDEYNSTLDEPAEESTALDEREVLEQQAVETENTLAAGTRAESQISLFNERASAVDQDSSFDAESESQQSPVTAVRDASSGENSGESKPAKKKPRKSRAAKAKTGKNKAAQEKASSTAPAPNASDEDVIILHLMAAQGAVFQGDELLKALIDNGLRYGSLKIFHRHVREDGSGDILFSMANSVNPGTFELNAMGEFLTPGVTFMMVLADSEDPLGTFDLMLECIHGIHTSIGGELKDQQRSALSQQTAEHYRQRIMDFNHRRLAAKA
ncbi:MAG: cell division protein ZipA [Gammaproteobacteria bacterium]|nr:cell division protein ZipA [Gammaproteobacteria bacterium]MBQ0840413.1 cell division protein ZipA [Gammaproteobacteria bacterium]